MTKYTIDNDFMKTRKYKNMYVSYWDWSSKNPKFTNFLKEYENFKYKLESDIEKDKRQTSFQGKGWSDTFTNFMLKIYKIDKYADYSYKRMICQQANIYY